MRKKRLTSMSLAVVLAAAAFGGVVSSADEPMEILMMKSDISKYTEDQTIKAMLEEKYNIVIKPEQLPSEQDAITLRIASGDIDRKSVV